MGRDRANAAFDGKSPETRRRYYTSLKKLRTRDVLAKDAVVNKRARVDWKALSAGWEESPADWNHLRREVSTFLSTLLGDVFHPFDAR